MPRSLVYVCVCERDRGGGAKLPSLYLCYFGGSHGVEDYAGREEKQVELL